MGVIQISSARCRAGSVTSPITTRLVRPKEHRVSISYLQTGTPPRQGGVTCGPELFFFENNACPVFRMTTDETKFYPPWSQAHRSQQQIMSTT